MPICTYCNDHVSDEDAYYNDTDVFCNHTCEYFHIQDLEADN